MKTKLLILAMTLTMCFSSCMVTRTNIGAYKENEGEEYTYAKGKQFWILWGLIPMGRTQVSIPENKVCQVSTRYNFGDGVVSLLSGGLIYSQTIKVIAKKSKKNK